MGDVPFKVRSTELQYCLLLLGEEYCVQKTHNQAKEPTVLT